MIRIILISESIELKKDSCIVYERNVIEKERTRSCVSNKLDRISTHKGLNLCEIVGELEKTCNSSFAGQLSIWNKELFLGFFQIR